MSWTAGLAGLNRWPATSAVEFLEMRKVSRRRFLAESSALSAATGALGWLGMPASAEDDVESGGSAARWAPGILPEPVIRNWRIGRQAVWGMAPGPTGGRFLRVLSKRGQRVAVSEMMPVARGSNYRLEAWLRAREGKARVGVELLDDRGRVVGSSGSPNVDARDEWTYVAVESPASRAASRARAWFWVQGSGDLGQVSLSPQSPLFFANGDFEKAPDAQGRITFWSEVEAIHEGRAAPGSGLPFQGRCGGKWLLDAAEKHSGTRSLQLSPTADWYAVSSLNYTVWRWSDRWEGRAWVRCSAGARARLFLLWSGDDPTNVIRVDAGTETQAANWAEAVTLPVEPPSEATQVRLVLWASGGPAWFDDAQLLTLPPARRVVNVLVNQVGYDLGGPKSAVIATNFFPEEDCSARFLLLDEADKIVYESHTACSGRIYGHERADWGWYFWRADFSAFDRAGKYRIKARAGGAEGASFPFGIGQDLLFSRTAPGDVEFFFVQRCGYAVPGWHAACHMDDARVNGVPRDLTGGWHSAGDYNKPAWEYADGAVVYALAAAARSVPDFFAHFDRDRDGVIDVMDEAEWGARYLAKIQVPETGGILGDIWQGPDRHAFFRWVPPEKQTDGIPGTADDPVVAKPEGNTPLAIAGWAAVSGLVRPGALREEYLQRAKKMLRYYQGKPWAERNPHVTIGAMELYQGTRRQEFLEYARQGVSMMLGNGGRISGGFSDSGDVPSAALALFALSFPDDPLSRQARTCLQQQLDFFVAEPRNPFGIARQKSGEEGYFFEPSSTLGQNFMFSARAWAALLIYRLTGDRRAWAYAVDQLDWILGKNPYNLCMMEGLGSFNPPRYHSRMDSIPGHERGAVPGAIPNGFVRDVGGYDRPGFDMSRTGRPHPSYRTSEHWLVHNVLHLLAVTELHRANASRMAGLSGPREECAGNGAGHAEKELRGART